MDLSELVYLDKFIGDEKISVICEKIRNSGARKLALRGNNLGPYGAKTVADCVAENNYLQELSLEWNLIGSLGAQHMAEALGVNRSIQQLDLRNNQIGSDAAIALADAMKTNMVLTTLDLRWNQIDDRGALAFKYALLERRPRLTLLITGNLLSESAMASILAWMNKEDMDIPSPPKAPEVPAQVTSELLSKDIHALRAEISALHKELEDLRRAYQQACMRITELESALSRENYKFLQLQDQHDAATLRISILNDEKATILSNWEKERVELHAELKRVYQEKDEEIKRLSAERDLLLHQLIESQDHCDQLRLQNESLVDQLAGERERAASELRLLRTKITELSISESKMRAHEISIESENHRLLERVKALEEELRLKSSEFTKTLKQYDSKYREDLQAQQQQHNLHVQTLNEKNVVLSQDVLRLQELLHVLRAEIDTQKMELEEAYEIALRNCRETERKKAEDMLADYRKRVEVLTQSNLELTIRCDQNAKEYHLLAEEHAQQLSRLCGQLSTLQAENDRLRGENVNLHGQYQHTLQVNKTLEEENKTKTKHLSQLEKQVRQISEDLYLRQTEKAQLERQVASLSTTLESVQRQRREDYETMKKTVLTSLSGQLDTMQVQLHYLDEMPEGAGGAKERQGKGGR